MEKEFEPEKEIEDKYEAIRKYYHKDPIKIPKDK